MTKERINNFIFKETETFKRVPGFPGYYADAEKGCVYTYRNGQKYMLSNKLSVCGYVMVCLHKLGEGRRVANIARIILETFNPVENMEKLDAAHLNGDTTDNRLCNLKWLTHRENIQMRGKRKHKYQTKNRPVYLVHDNEEKTIEYFRCRKECYIS